MLTDDDLRQVLASIGADAPVRAEEVTASTNETALGMADGGAPEWTLVTAAHQTAGRGRLGRSWHDVAGRSLLVSVVLRPALEPEEAGLLPLLAGASMAEAIGASAGRDVRCKWPNDLLLGGAKVGGILAESRVADGRLEAVVLGVGVNLEPPGVEGATGIGPVALRDLLEAFLVRFHGAYLGGGDLAEVTRARWIRVADTVGREVRAISDDGEEVRGTATGIDDRGGLVLATAAGPRTVTSGEILHLR